MNSIDKLKELKSKATPEENEYLDALLEVVRAAKEIDKHYPPRNHDLNALVVALAELEE